MKQSIRARVMGSFLILIIAMLLAGAGGLWGIREFIHCRSFGRSSQLKPAPDIFTLALSPADGQRAIEDYVQAKNPSGSKRRFEKINRIMEITENSRESPVRKVLWYLLFIIFIGILMGIMLSNYLVRTAERNIELKEEAEGKVHELSSELLRSQERERQRISKDLHDSVGQLLDAAQINLKTYKKNPGKFPLQFSRGLDSLSRASRELREIYTGLYPSILNDFGLPETIKWYTKNYLNAFGIDTSLDLRLQKEISHDLKVNIYRIIQELFSNIVKYSQATRVKVRMLVRKGRFLQIEVSDNGIGFSRAEVKKRKEGFGLANIQKRVENFHGEIILQSSVNRGTRFLIKVSI